jgi:dolichol-phosphate mannosyltransferase
MVRPLVSVVVPCHNEEKVLPALYERLTQAARTWPCDYEVVGVDDGSRDATWRLLQDLARRDPRWSGLSFSRNFGQAAAISAGLQHCRGDAAIIIDADLQDPPEELIRFITAWQSGAHVVHGVRSSRRDPLFKRLSAWFFHRLQRRLSDVKIPADSGEFALLDRRVLDVLNRLPEHNRYLRGLRTWCGFRQEVIAFERPARAAGNSRYTVGDLLQIARNGVFSFSTRPLQLIVHLGMIVAAGAGVLALAVLVRAALGAGAASPWLLLLAAIAFLAGLQLFCLGILGEYVGRIHDEVRNRPPWIVREQTADDAGSKAGGGPPSA